MYAMVAAELNFRGDANMPVTNFRKSFSEQGCRLVRTGRSSYNDTEYPYPTVDCMHNMPVASETT
jgi:hypothetical protein